MMEPDSMATLALIESQPPHFREFLRRLFRALALRIREEWAESSGILRGVADDMVGASADDLARWSGLLASGAIAPKDYQWLVQGRVDLARMETLRKAGFTRSQIDRFRAILVETVVRTAVAFFLRRP